MAANPIQIVPLREAELAPVSTAKLTYRGGPLLGAVEAFTFFWGDAWLQAPQSALVGEINKFFDFILASALLDQLSEYSVPATTIGHGTRTGSKTVPGAGPAQSVTDADVQRFIQDQLAAGPSLPQPNPSSLYFVYLPPGTSIAMDSGASCVNFCGYHSDFATGGGSVYYAVMPYPGCSGCLGGMTDVDALTATSSHELCEAITDPVPGQGWYDDQNGEIGDICAWQSKRLGGYAVQLEWSNRAGRCI